VGLDARARDRHGHARAEATSRSSGARTAGRPRRPGLRKRDDGLDVTLLSTRRTIRTLVSDPESFDVIVCALPLLVPLAELGWCLDARRVLAWGRLAQDGPGIFGPSHGTAVDIAGQGVADPSSMLLAAALMLGEGLGERGAAATLSSAVSYVRGNGGRARRRYRLGGAAS
jgi:isocitrate/isopropylmalate dehydrogenase